MIDTGGVGDAALVLTGAAIVVSLLTRRHRSLALAVAAATATVAAGALAWGLLTGDFTLAVVADVSNRELSWWYRLSGLWAGLASSMLLATWFVIVAAWLTSRRTGWDRAAGPLAVVGLSGGAVMAAVAPPFERLAAPALDGVGLVPLLEHPAMLVHPPLLYVGLTAALVPAALVVGGDRNPVRLRRASAGAAGVLVAGLTLGAAWAFAELGWGGWWAWDPVENAGLVPMLALVAVVHLVRSGRSTWARIVALVAAAVAVAGGVITRTGAAVSVHAFAEDPDATRALWLWLAGLVVAAVVAALRQPAASAAGGRRDGRWELAAAAASSLATLVVAVGTATPIVARSVWGTEMTVGGTFYATLLAPLAVASVVGTVAVARRVSLTAKLSHLGLALVVVGALVSTVGETSTVVARPDGVAQAGPGGRPVTIVALDVEVDDVDDPASRQTVVVVVDVGDRRITSRQRIDPVRGLVTAEPGVDLSITGDVVVAVRRVIRDGPVQLEVTWRPGGPLIWLGAAAMVVGLGASARPISRRSYGASDEAGRRPWTARARAQPSSGPVPAREV